MKFFFTLLVGFISFNIAYTQTDLSGKYWTISCGSSNGYFLRLFPDSTAHFTPIYEYADKYYSGNWQQSNDTLIVEISDTSEYSNKFEYFLIKDSLHLEKINKEPVFLLNTLYRHEAYYPNGDIRYKIEYGPDETGNYIFNGRFFQYFPQKRLEKIIDYKDGLKHGIEINLTWYGYMVSSGYWKKGLKHGTWQYYDSDYNQTGQEIFKNGQLKSGSNSGSVCFPGYDPVIYKKLFQGTN